jgi:two-component system, OmpR family, aerobic respiration control sensor histidine kinase ArcB
MDNLKQKSNHYGRIRQSIDDIKMMLQSIPANVYWKDTEGIYRSCYFNALDDFTLTKDDFLNRRLDDIAGLDKICDIEAIKKNDALVIESGKSVVIQEVILNKQLAEHTFLTHKKPLYDEENRIVGLFGISIDITGYDFLAKPNPLTNKPNALQPEHIEQLRHNLRTPCHGILGLSQMLYSEEQDSEKRKKLGYITESAIRLYKVLNESFGHSSSLPIPEKAALTAPDLEQPIVKDIKALLSNTAASLMPSNSDLIHYKLSYSATLPNQINIDKRKLLQVIKPLMQSLLQSKQAIELTIHIDCPKGNTAQEPQLVITFTVVAYNPSDTSNTLAYFAHSQHAMEEATTSIQSLNGLIHIAITKNQYQLICTLPLCSEKKKETSLVQPSIPFPQPKKPNKKSVLVIEDDKIALYFALSILKKLDCSVDMAMSGKEAKKFVNKKYDIILMDIALPDTTGFELIKFFKQNSTNDAKIIGITAHAYEAYQSKAKNLGFEQLLPKPLNHNILKKLISSNLRQSY